MINCFGFCSFICASCTPLPMKAVNKISVMNGAFDTLLVTSIDEGGVLPALPDGWDVNTIMRADFENNVGAGNVDYSFYEASKLRIKRREVGTNTWITIMSIPVPTPQAFSFTVYDRLNRSDTDYEYAIVPVVNSIEGAIVAKQVHSEFDGLCVFDGEKLYYTIMDIVPEKSRSQSTAILKPLMGKYPYRTRFNQLNYSHGSIMALFWPAKGYECGFTPDGALDYREGFIDFLMNENPKILKDYRGHIWLVQTDGDIDDVENGHPSDVSTKFGWIEIADAKSEDDLREYGFIAPEEV